jgi:glyoxylase-like metal-dependent hydrolase (beta-lactamase superfamily II)
MPLLSLRRRLVAAAVVPLLFGALVGCTTPDLDSGTVIAGAQRTMGGAQLKSIRYTADGTGYTFGQFFVPGMPWPKITVHALTRSVDYGSASMRDEITLSRAEPRGGGGYPLQGQQRNDQYLSGAFAWNQAAAGPQPGPRFVADRVHQLWITPHGALKAAARNNAAAQTRNEGGATVTALKFREPGRFDAIVIVGADGLVQRVESRAPDAVLGEVDVVTRYSGYRDVGGGVKFPGRIEQSMAGQPVLDVTVRDVQPNAAVDIAVPDAVRNAAERVTTDKLADGVWHVTGGSHNSVAIEMRDHFVLVEAPLNDGRSQPVIDAVKALAPAKPIRYVINSHVHFDHAGGLRTAVADGATIVTQAGNVPYFERAFATPNRIAPDRLTQSGRRATFLAVNDKATLSDGTRTVDIHRITDSVHNDTFLMVHLPNEKILIEADAYTPLAPGAAPPPAPNANHVNLIANIERLKLQVDRIAPLHGRVVPLGELYTTAGRPLPR